MKDGGICTTTVPDNNMLQVPEDTDWFVWDEEMERYMSDLFQLICSDDE